jgi:hypothetical protein
VRITVSVTAVRRREPEIVRVQRQVLDAIRKLSSPERPAVKVQKVATLIQADPRTVRNHLQVLVVNDKGVFLDQDDSVFALNSNLNRLVSVVQARVRNEDLLDAIEAEAGDILLG